MASFMDTVRAQRLQLPLIPKSFANETIIVTGANTGLGLETARHCVNLGASRVILAVRSLARGDAAKADIESTTKRPGVAEVWLLDLASYDSIKAFAERASRELKRIDKVIENAGIALDRWTVAEGSETTITVNVIGTFLLALLLLPKMSESGKVTGTTPTLTILTSDLHAWAKFEESKADDIFAELEVEKSSRMTDRYNTSKLIEVYIVRALAERLPLAEYGVIINTLNPGLCSTDLIRNVGTTFTGWLTKIFVKIMRAFLARTAEEGSRTLLHAAVAGLESHGKYLSDCAIKDHWVRPDIKTEKGRKLQDKLWAQLSARLEKIDHGSVTRALKTK